MNRTVLEFWICRQVNTLAQTCTDTRQWGNYWTEGIAIFLAFLILASCKRFGTVIDFCALPTHLKIFIACTIIMLYSSSVAFRRYQGGQVEVTDTVYI